MTSPTSDEMRQGEMIRRTRSVLGKYGVTFENGQREAVLTGYLKHPIIISLFPDKQLMVTFDSPQPVTVFRTMPHADDRPYIWHYSNGLRDQILEVFQRLMILDDLADV